MKTLGDENRLITFVRCVGKSWGEIGRGRAGTQRQRILITNSPLFVASLLPPPFGPSLCFAPRSFYCRHGYRYLHDHQITVEGTRGYAMATTICISICLGLQSANTLGKNILTNIHLLPYTLTMPSHSRNRYSDVSFTYYPQNRQGCNIRPSFQHNHGRMDVRDDEHRF